MALFRCQVVIPMFTNIPEDVVTNTLYFEENTPLGLNTVAAEMTPRIKSFYESIYSGSDRMANYMQPHLATCRWYDMSQPEPRVPVILNPGLVITTAVSSVPTEAAAVLSFQADRQAGESQSRRRGRIYLGGLGPGAIAAGSTNTFPALGSGIRTSMSGAAQTLISGAVAETMRWVVWSPTAQESYTITNGWVDNAIDTQRRRSVMRTARIVWPTP